MHANIKSFLMKSVKQQLFPLLEIELLHPDQMKNVQEMKPTGFDLRWPCDPQARSRSVKVV